ncbi:hypothetical protein FACS1894202_14430 [Clostridia bacterium]|nr:hypothetical protein FACS1894202_14430 [Clostridia bacterium]
MDSNGLKELRKATRADGNTLHIVQQLNAEYTPFVICWHFDGKTWDWGTYCQTLEQAERVFNEKAAEYEFSVERQTPVYVGRIDFLGGNGEVGESIEYTDEQKFLADIKRENYCGAPMTITLYCDDSGQTIPRDFMAELDPPVPIYTEDYEETDERETDDEELEW